VGDAAAQEVRTEGLWRFGPEQFAVALSEFEDWRCRQPIQLGLDGWIGFNWTRAGFHEATPALPMR
jgi:hypothetical protein